MNAIDKLKLDRDLAWTDYCLTFDLDQNSDECTKAQSKWVDATTTLIRELKSSNNYGKRSEDD